MIHNERFLLLQMNFQSHQQNGRLFRIIIILILFQPFQLWSQNQFTEDIVYKRWSFHMNNMMYRPGQATVISGKYDIHTELMRGYRVGFEYFFKSKHQWKLYTGLDMHFFPFIRYNFSFSGEELNLVNVDKFEFDNYDYNFKRHNVISIPIGLIYQQPISYRMSTHLKVGVNIDILNYGSFGFGGYSTDKDGNDIHFHQIELVSMRNNVFYPGIFIAYGIDWYTKWSILHISLNGQKSIIPYMKGTYEIMNLKNSPNTIGTYTLRGDYIGIDLGITLKKFKT